MTVKLKPASEAIAFRVAMWCRDHGWDHTSREVAEAIDVSPSRVAVIAGLKGWTERFRVSPKRKDRLDDADGDWIGRDGLNDLVGPDGLGMRLGNEGYD